MMRSVSELLRVDFGIDARPVLTTSLTLRQRAYPDETSRAAVFERLLARVAAVPGIDRAALASGWPLQDPAARELLADAPARVSTSSTISTVSAGYFETLGMPIIAGRGVEPGDRAQSEPVVVISETLARRIAPGGRALDARISILPPAGAVQTAPPIIPRRVVGVVRDVRKSPTDPDLADVYVPLPQSPGRSVWLYTRTAGEPSTWTAALREAVRDVDPEISLADVRPLQGAIDQQLSRPAFLAWLLSGFAFVAAALSLVGVYGVIAYAVRQREREIAVRMAIGASPAAITRLFVRQGGLVVCVGLLIGVPLALAAGRILETQLFGIRPGDPWSLGLTVIAFGLAGLAAVWWPARRAAGADPAGALKAE
jgi:predicted permease